MQDFEFRQSDGPDAEVIGECAKTFGFDKVAIGYLRESKTATVQCGIDQKHGAADRIEADTIEMSDIAEIQAALPVGGRLVEAASYVTIVAIVFRVPGRDETVEIKAAFAGNFQAVRDNDAVAGGDQALQGIVGESPDVNIHPQRPVVGCIEPMIDKVIAYLGNRAAPDALQSWPGPFGSVDINADLLLQKQDISIFAG